MDTKKPSKRRRDDLLRRIRREPGQPAEDKDEPLGSAEKLSIRFPPQESSGPSNAERKAQQEKSRMLKATALVRRRTGSHKIRDYADATRCL